MIYNPVQMQNASFSSPQYFEMPPSSLLKKLCEPPWNQCTVVTPELYICWVTLAELIWLCSIQFHWSMPLCNGAVVFECDVDGTCGQEGALLFWSAVTVLLQCLSISSIHSLSHTVTETQVKFLCVTCAAFFCLPLKAKFKAGVEHQDDLRMTF